MLTDDRPLYDFLTCATTVQAAANSFIIEIESLERSRFGEKWSAFSGWVVERPYVNLR